MVLGAINHVAITVGDFGRAKAFYRPLLEFMGYELSLETGALMVWESAAAGSAVNLWLAKPEFARRRHERHAPGLHHVAFNADSREQVDRLGALLREWHVDVLDPPAQYDEYAPGYYAVYFQDPDGLKLEFTYIPS